MCVRVRYTTSLTHSSSVGEPERLWPRQVLNKRRVSGRRFHRELHPMPKSSTYSDTEKENPSVSDGELVVPGRLGAFGPRRKQVFLEELRLKNKHRRLFLQNKQQRDSSRPGAAWLYPSHSSALLPSRKSQLDIHSSGLKLYVIVSIVTARSPGLVPRRYNQSS